MALQHSPPIVQKCASNPDIRDALKDGVCIRKPKRKQPDDYDIDNKLAGLEQRFEKHLESYYAKIDESITSKITDSINKNNSILSSITNSLTDINAAIMGLRNDNTLLHASLKDLNGRLTEMDASLSTLDTRQDSFNTRLELLENQTAHSAALPDQVLMLENKLKHMEQHARECNIEIMNLPERRGENLMTVMTTLSAVIDFKIQPNDIISIHRVPHPMQNDKRSKNVIVKFISRILRDNFIAAFRARNGISTEQLSFPGMSHKIYINEHLTLHNKHLFRETRERAKTQGFKYVWVKHGTVLARKNENSPAVAIRNVHDMAKIK